MIAYKVHFQILFLAAITLSLSSFALDKVPSGDSRLLSSFALVGALHATALVISLRYGSAIRRIAFIVLAAVLSAVTIMLAIMVVPVLDTILGDSARFFLFLSLASALGASGYWLLVRRFWMRSLKFGDLVITVALCITATLLSWGAGMLIMLQPSARKADKEARRAIYASAAEHEDARGRRKLPPPPSSGQMTAS